MGGLDIKHLLYQSVTKYFLGVHPMAFPSIGVDP